MTETTATTAPAEEKKSIGQKVDELQAEKTRLTSELNEMPEGPEKTGKQERIAVIDRKLRWYAGRSGEGKSQRPTKASGSKGRGKGNKAETKATEKVAQPAVASTSANES